MFKIIKANFYKHKNSMISLFILITITSMLLSIGLNILFHIKDFYWDKVDEFKSPHISYYINTFDDRIDAILEEAKTYNGISKFEVEDVLLTDSINILDSEHNLSKNMFILNENTQREQAPLVLIDEVEIYENIWIALPYFFKTNFKYKSGDNIQLEINAVEYNFKIKGFFEDTFYSLPITGVSKVFLSEDAYIKLENEMDYKSKGGKLLSVRFLNSSDVQQYSNYLKKIIDDLPSPKSSFFNTVYKLENGATTFINIIAIIIIGFSFIMVCVALIVVTFSITTGIEDEVQLIGIYKAIGFKNMQIIFIVLLQYTILTLLSLILGIFISALFMKGISELLSYSSGLIWNYSYSSNVTLITIFYVLFLVWIVTYFSVLKTKKITPITALRHGIEVHNFKQNLFPLEKSKLNLNLAIILKNIVGNPKQNIVILFITIGFTFAGSFSIQLYHNIILNNKPFQYMIGFPLHDLFIRSRSTISLEKLEQIEDIEKIIRFDKFGIKIEDIDAEILISNSFDEIDRKTIIKGRYPIYNNEVSISVLISKQLNKNVGDFISITINKVTKEFLITGETQQIFDEGLVLEITESGYKTLDKDYVSDGFILNLKENIEVEHFSEMLKSKYREISITNINEMLESQFSPFELAIKMIMIFILLITIVTISLILYMMLRVKLIREKINLGIYKSLGFTTLQLMVQISCSFASVIMISTIIGGILGGLYTNSVLSILLNSLGIRSANFITNYILIIILVIVITLISFIISMFATLQIKKITVYNLLVE